jgi:hypothetical protein
MAERLLELKNSDPELFSQAWKKIPQSTQDNILAYLKKHGSDADGSSPTHGSFEDKNAHFSKHKALIEHQSESARIEKKEHDSKHLNPPTLLIETRKGGQLAGRPLFEWTDGELLAHTLLEPETKESISSAQDKTDSDLSSVLRSISRQNTVQIVQNELMRRLLQTIAGKT